MAEIGDEPVEVAQVRAVIAEHKAMQPGKPPVSPTTIEAEYSLLASEPESEILIQDMEFTYRIASNDPCLIERCPNADVNRTGALWYWYLRRDTDIEAKISFLRLSKSMGLPVQEEELVYDEYDIDFYAVDEDDDLTTSPTGEKNAK